MAATQVGSTFTQEVTAFAVGGFSSNSYSLDGSANALILHIHWLGISEAPTTVFWNTSEEMTQIDSFVEGGDGFGVAAYILENPTTGSHTFTINGITNGTGGVIAGMGFSGVDTGTSITGGGTHASATNTGPATDDTGASVGSDDLAIDAVTVNDGVALTDDGGNSTQMYQQAETTIGFCKGAGSRETGTGTITTSWTFTGTESWVILNYVLKGTAANINISPPQAPAVLEGRQGLMGFTINMPTEP